MSRTGFFLVCLSFLIPAWGAEESLEQCISRLEEKSQFWQEKIPPVILHADRNLHQILIGVSALRENAKGIPVYPLEAKGEDAKPFLYWNAVAGCLAYEKHFQHYLEHFLLFFGVASISILLSIIYFFLAPRWRSAQLATSPPPKAPEDRASQVSKFSP